MDKFGKGHQNTLQRQQLPTYYRYNGAIYLLKTEELYEKKMFAKGCFAYVMRREESVDIDEEVDFLLAEALLRLRKQSELHLPNSITSV